MCHVLSYHNTNLLTKLRGKYIIKYLTRIASTARALLSRTYRDYVADCIARSTFSALYFCERGRRGKARTSYFSRVLHACICRLLSRHAPVPSLVIQPWNVRAAPFVRCIQRPQKGWLARHTYVACPRLSKRNLPHITMPPLCALFFLLIAGFSHFASGDIADRYTFFFAYPEGCIVYNKGTGH